MGTVVEKNRSVASVLAAERFRMATDLAIEGRNPYPNGAAFLPADLPSSGERLLEYSREHRPVVLVYPDGEERLVVSLPDPPAIERAVRFFGQQLAKALRKLA